jgi:hypothetical protein
VGRSTRSSCPGRPAYRRPKGRTGGSSRPEEKRGYRHEGYGTVSQLTIIRPQPGAGPYSRTIPRSPESEDPRSRFSVAGIGVERPTSCFHNLCNVYINIVSVGEALSRSGDTPAEVHHELDHELGFGHDDGNSPRISLAVGPPWTARSTALGVSGHLNLWVHKHQQGIHGAGRLAESQ